MSWVAEANAEMINNIRVRVNILIGVCPSAIIAASGFGNVSVSSIINAVIITCIEIIHQRLVLTTSTSGPHSPFRNQGKYNGVVKNAISPLGAPILVNIITEILFTTKYGTPSAKYKVGTQNHGDSFLSEVFMSGF